MAEQDGRRGRAGTVGLFLGPAIVLAMQLAGPPEGLSREAWIVASVALLMATWWATEAIPIPATSLIPLVAFPPFEILTTRAAGAPYMSPIVLLLLAGFIIALALERWRLHERIALNIVVRAGGRPRLLILGFMIAAALLSMWISNTATTLMMIPIALSVAAAEERDGGEGRPVFTLALLLGIAYAASIGGVATPVGTPTNLIAMGYLEENADRSVSFPQWMALGVPAAALMIPAAWLVVTRFAMKVPAQAPAEAAASAVRERLTALGGLTMPEARVAIVFGLVAVAWISRQFVLSPFVDGLEAEAERLAAAGSALAADAQARFAYWKGMNGSSMDAVIAVTGALALFLIPAGGKIGARRPLMDWDTAVRLPWGVIILFGGGLSLAAAMRATGLAGWLGEQLAFLASWPPLLIVVLFVAAIIFLTELTSNVATVTAFMPVMADVAVQAQFDPLILAAPAAIAGSCAFMLPVATAPNAIVYATGKVRISDMIRTGFRVNLAGVVLITLSAGLLAQLMY